MTYEGQVYNTVLIGNQCWLKENLNVGTRIDGLLNQSNNSILEKYCYDDQEANCRTYGGLYQWNEMMKYTVISGERDICPEGWHIPADSEWCILKKFLDEMVDCNLIYYSGFDIGLKLKSTSGWNSGGNGTNQSGYTGLPGGVRYSDYFGHLGNVGLFWTSTSSGPGAIYHTLGNSHNTIGRFVSDFNDNHGLSVRCIKDSDTGNRGD